MAEKSPTFNEENQEAGLSKKDDSVIDLNPNATAFAKLMEGHHVRSMPLNEFLDELKGVKDE